MSLIPSNRLVDWTPGVYTGVPGGIPTDRTNIIDVTQSPYNVDNTGTDDITSVVQAIIDASSEGDIIYFPAGEYKTSGLNFAAPTRNNRTIRGAGPSLTTFKPYGAAGAFYIGGSDGWTQPSPPKVITAGLTKGSNTITVDDATDFVVGHLMLLGFQNQTDETALEGGDTVVFSDYGFDTGSNQPNRLQVVKLLSKTGTTLTFFPELYHTPPSGSVAQVWYAQLQTTGAGLEDFYIDMTDTTAVSGIQMEHCFGCWVKNVKVAFSANYCLEVFNSLQCEVRDCELRERRGGGSNGSALLTNTVSGCLFENNLLYRVFPTIEVNAGSSGNVYAYNLCENPPIDGFIFFGIDTNHSPHNAFNLYEGNISPNLVSDGYFGSNSDDTVFRNWFHGTHYAATALTFTYSLKRFTRNYSNVGNIIGRHNISVGAFNYGTPNIGSGSSIGECQPTEGTFWNDFNATGVLTTRTSDTAGTLTLNSGSVSEGQLVFLRWDGNKAQSLNVTSVSGDEFSWTGGAGTVLPSEGTTVNVFMGPAGYQELDLDVEASTIDKGNYLYSAAGTPGSMSSLDGDTLPDSLFRTEAPAFFDGFTFPPFDPTSPDSAAYENLPRGAQFVADVPPAAPSFVTEVTIAGIAIQQQVLTATPGLASGIPTPSHTLQWQRDGVDIDGETGLTYTLVIDDVGTVISVIDTATNSEGSDTSSDSTGEIQAYMGDILVINQTSNSSPVTELWKQAAVGSTPTEVVVHHSGNYPTQPVNGFVYAKHGPLDKHVYIFNGTITLSDAITARDNLTPELVPMLVTRPNVTFSGNLTDLTVGSTLTATAGTYTESPTSYSRQWRRDGVAIDGATSLTYDLTADDQGHGISFYETATNIAGSSQPVRATTGYPRPFFISGDSLWQKIEITTDLQTALGSSWDVINVAHSGDNIGAMETKAQTTVDPFIQKGWGVSFYHEYANQVLGIQGGNTGAETFDLLEAFGQARQAAGAGVVITSTCYYRAGHVKDGTEAHIASELTRSNFATHSDGFLDLDQANYLASADGNGDGVHWAIDTDATLRTDVITRILAKISELGLQDDGGDVAVPNAPDFTHLKTFTNPTYVYDTFNPIPATLPFDPCYLHVTAGTGWDLGSFLCGVPFDFSTDDGIQRVVHIVPGQSNASIDGGTYFFSDTP